MEYTLTLTSEELCYIRQALTERQITWERTAVYLESESNDPDLGEIEDETDPAVARRIADSYAQTLDKISAIDCIATASLFDEDLMTRLRVRETQIEQGLGVKANNVDERG